MNEIWVHLESVGDQPNLASLELVSGARRLAERVVGFCLGPVSEALATEFGAHGTSSIIDLGGIQDAMAAPRLAARLAARLGAGTPDAIFFASSYEGRDGAARLSARLDRPVLANVVDLVELDGKLVATHALFGATLLAKASFTGPSPHLFIIRPRTFVAERLDAPPATLEQASAVDAGETDRAGVIAHHEVESSGPDLDAASIVVTGGRGLGERESFALVEQLAALLKGAPAATRAIVDAGWVPYSYQVGQTGKTVKPELYIACGVSGATQHLVGMKGSRHVIAINRDENAPIFKLADLGIVGDVNVVLPGLIEALEKRS